MSEEQLEEQQAVEEVIQNEELLELELSSGENEEEEFLEVERVASIIESILFATDKPQSVANMRQAFSGTNIRTKDIKKAVEQLMVDYASADRGVFLEEVNGGYQLRTKVDNMTYLKRMIKGRSFKLSGPALEVLSIVAYKQPCVKAQIDEIRGVESGHLLRSLMERSLVNFAGKSEMPGKPMLYQTTKKFLEIFGLRNLKELPTLNEIDELIPEGIGEEVQEKETLDELTDRMSQDAGQTYSEGEEELTKITDQLGEISTSSEFFEQEKQRVKDKRDQEKAQDIREALVLGDEVSTRDKNWLERYDQAQEEKAAAEVAEDKILVESHDDDLVNQEVNAEKLAEDLEIFNEETQEDGLSLNDKDETI